MRAVRDVLHLLGELVYPRSCALCDRTLDRSSIDWCPDCVGLVLAATGSDYCGRCAATAEPHTVNEAGCKHCRDASAPIDGFARVGSYEGPIGSLVRRYKYDGQQRLDRVLASMLADALRSRPWCGRIDALVPVPATLTERWRYRFWPVGLLAQSAGQRLGLPYLPMMVSGRRSRRQVDVNPSERAANVRGKFVPHRLARVNGSRLCLIDDVATSNATLRECARALKRAGAAEVFAAVVAKATPGRDRP
jgi:ComF family protein